MQAIENLLSDGKGLVGLGLILAATVLVVVGKMPLSEWQTFATWIFGIYAGSTALHGGLSSIGNGMGASGAAAQAAQAAVASGLASVVASSTAPTGDHK